MDDEKQVVTCSHCKTQLRFKPRPGLEKIPCPKCKKEVLVGLSKLIAELPSFDYSKLAPAATGMVKSSTKGDKAENLSPSDYFPDFRVRNFWTPYIVAFLWTAFLAVNATQVVGSIVITGIMVCTRPTVQLVVGWILFSLLLLVLSVLVGMVVRIALETIQVLFHIEEHLRD